MVDHVKTSNFIIKKNRKRCQDGESILLRRIQKPLKLNNENESIDLSFGLDIEPCTIEENATPL
jgi:hypothetical protein